MSEINFDCKDICKIIDDAMEKRDRTVHIFITDTSVSINISPNTDDGMKWIETGIMTYTYKCSKCGLYSGHPDLYCKHCGEQRTGIIYADDYTKKEKEND